jgi:hypothetical protein
MGKKQRKLFSNFQECVIRKSLEIPDHIPRLFDLLSHNCCLRCILYETPTPNHCTVPGLKFLVSPNPHTYITEPVQNDKNIMHTEMPLEFQTLFICVLIRFLFCCGSRMVSAPASYSGGPGFKQARRWDILTEGLRGFPRSLQANAGIVPQIKPRPLPSMILSN